MIKYLILCVLLVSTSVVSAPKPINWSFPKDYGPHNSFNTEWWYFTGHLTTADNTLYGFQVTFFRYKLDQVSNSISPFNAPQLYSAHFALTDSKHQKFLFDDSHARDSFNQVISSPNQLDLQVKDWHLVYKDNTFFIDLKTAKGNFMLQLKPSKPKVFHGDKGISYKNANHSHYSHYYSHTRLNGQGKFIGADKTLVFNSASAWMDREIFNNLLSQEQVGWYWMAIQLDTNEELMVFKVNGTRDHYYSGTLVDRQGRSVAIASQDIKIEPLEIWKSPKSGQQYPIKWKVSVKASQSQKYPAQSYIITATLKNQELKVSHPFSLFYWEGQGLVTGTKTGKAYVEIAPLR
jgi:predicted secreted hydrolase